MNNAVTFNLADLQKLVAEGVAQALAAKGKGGSKVKTAATLDGKSERSIKNEIQCVKAFKKAGFGNVTPHVDVMSFNRWAAKGFRPIEGTKSVKVLNLRLFHVSQVRELTLDEKQKLAKQNSEAVARFDAAKQGTGPQLVQ